MSNELEYIVRYACCTMALAGVATFLMLQLTEGKTDESFNFLAVTIVSMCALILFELINSIFKYISKS